MAKTLLNDKNLEMFIHKLGIDQERKDFLLSKLPQMDIEDRIKLFNTLKDVYLLGLEEKEMIERVKKFSQE